MESNVIVVKVGTKCVIEDGAVKRRSVALISREIAKLKEEKGIRAILVVSGAVEIGKSILKLEKKPNEKIGLQRCAGVGQIGLITLWANELSYFGIISSQYLLTYQNFESEEEQKNIILNLEDDITHGIVPVINFNDKIDSHEVALDNDRLSSKIAVYAGAEKLILLSNDVEGLMDGGRLIGNIRSGEIERYKKCCNGAGESGTGGMITKLEAAQEIVSAGGECIIANADHEISEILGGFSQCTKISK